ncbi:unnamed protein product, partial [Anisakis simplex]|uniref:Carboxylic ester hydrolase n=1 Tax=Anisakis simplex TaxID=6269 RepID=A0A0M3K5G6_ANISI
VNTSRGAIYGFHVDYGNDASSLYFGDADVFLGIPYARAPVGHLRFAQTKPLLKFKSGYYNASKHSKYCPQTAHFDKNTMSENCLKLNIFTPAVSGLLWNDRFRCCSNAIYGGLTEGNARELDIPGAITNFVSRDVIVVTVQYRVGVLGFFTTNTDDFPPNRGLHDAATALNWVYDEIEAFGGNRSEITIFGISAGSSIVSALTLSPLTRDIIHQAIMQSGSLLTMYDGYIRQPSKRSQILAEMMCNCSATEWESKRFGRLRQCMEHATMYFILDNDYEYGKQVNDFGWLITADNLTLPDTPQTLAEQRPNIPVMIGTARDEFYYFVATVFQLNFVILNRFSFEGVRKENLETISVREHSTTLEDFNSTFHRTLFDRIVGNITEKTELNEMIYELISAIYVRHGVPELSEDDHERWLKTTVETFGGLFFIAPIAKEIEWYRNGDNKDIFIYEFDYESDLVHTDRFDDWKPISHTEEICFIFLSEECWKRGERENRTVSMDHTIADRLGQLWTDFAKTGVPSPSWEPFDDIDSFKYYSISSDPSMKCGYSDKHRYAWNDVS